MAKTNTCDTKGITYNGKEIIGTTKYRARLQKRNEEFVKLFDSLREQNPRAKRFTLCRAAAVIVGGNVSAQNVYNILRKNGRV